MAQSILTLTPTIDINAVNSFGVYFRTRIEANSVNNRFNLRVVEKESTSNFTSLDIRPNSDTQLNYRDKDGGQQSLLQGSGLITVADSFVNFRLDFVKTGSGTMSLTAYTYNTATKAWDQFTASTVDARFSTIGTNADIFETFQISATNSGETGRAVFDGFAIAVIPEPSSLALLGSSLALFVFLPRKHVSHP